MPGDSNSPTHGILSKLWAGKKSVDQEKGADERHTADLSAFENRLNAILKSHKDDNLKDQVFLLDLGRIHERLGDQWDHALDKIHKKIDGIIRAQITPRDIFIRRDSDTYFLMFDGLPRIQGHLKANIVNEEIARALIGEKDATQLTCVKDVVIDASGNVNLVEAPNKDQLIAEIVGNADSERSGRAAPSYEAPINLDGVEFVYRPMLVTRTRVVSTYVCIPVRRDHLGQYESSYSILGRAPSANEIAELDHYTQHVAADELGDMIKTHHRSLLALPVHFETLASVQRRMKYLGNLENVMEANTNRIVFEMVGLPDNIPQPRIIELTSALRRHSRAIIARFAPDHGNFPAYRTAGLHAVGIDVFNLNKPEKLLIKDMDAFVESAKQNQLRTYAHGIRSISLLTAAICAGFDYLDGYALSSVATGAMDVHGFSLAQPYLEYQNKLDK